MQIRPALHACFAMFSLFFIQIGIAYADLPTLPAQLEIRVPQGPQPMKAENKYDLVYEVVVTNYQSVPVTLTKLVVNSDRRPLIFTGNELAKLIHPAPMDSPYPETAPLLFQPGMSKIILMFLKFNQLSDVPASLIHQISAKATINDKDALLTVTTLPLTINKTIFSPLQAPLSGEHWLAVNAPSNTSHHRTSHLVVNGINSFMERFAIDFIKIGPNGMSYQGDEHDNTSYFSYGNDVYAAADGTVVATQDGIPENTPHTGQLAIPITLDTLGGNDIILDIGQGRYAFYAHLIPGSLTVRRGDHVHAGDILGKLGNSGNSTEPHLHFQLTDRPSAIAGNSIPYQFDHIIACPSEIIEDKVSSTYKIDIHCDRSISYIDQLVLENTVINFP